MSALFLARLAVPRSALPVDGVLGRILVEAFPPDGVVVKVKRNVCEMVFFLVAASALGLDFSFVPGATPKKPFSGLIA